MDKKVILAILDGWGIAEDETVSAIDAANTPFIDQLYDKYGHATLKTDGQNVGLPDGQMGNSEVGHMNLGAGRIVDQFLVKVNKAVDQQTIDNEEALQKAFTYAKENDKKVHFLGLVSDGGVHSHIYHLEGLIKAAERAGIKKSYVHAFTDGRDVDPYSGKSFIERLNKTLDKTPTQLASVIGRYYAMDRDKRWERTAKAYHLLVNGKGKSSKNAIDALQASYDNDITDEFIDPIVLTENDQPLAKIAEDDVVIFFNFRTDRGRQLTQALTQDNFKDHQMQKLPLHMLTMTEYDQEFNGINIIYGNTNIEDTLGEILEQEGKSQLRAAETEKYPHVTYFFSGGREKPFRGERRIMVNSPKVATYDLQPEMSAYELRDELLPEIKNQNTDFMCVNFANPDMVGHTGVFDAAVKACETVDECMRDLVTTAEENDYSVIIIADHGNSDKMKNPDGSPNTAHTTNLVPVILVDPIFKRIKDGILGDIAPTILDLMGLDKPQKMTQDTLL